MLTDEIRALLNRLDERDRQVVTMTLQGYSVQEISAEIGRSERTVQRVLERLKAELQQRSAVDD